MNNISNYHKGDGKSRDGFYKQEKRESVRSQPHSQQSSNFGISLPNSDRKAQQGWNGPPIHYPYPQAHLYANYQPYPHLKPTTESKKIRIEDLNRWNEYENGILSALAGYFATTLSSEADGKVNIDLIPWNYISHFLTPKPITTERENKYQFSTGFHSAESCKAQWKKLFKHCFFMKTKKGVKLCKYEKIKRKTNRNRKKPRKNWTLAEKSQIAELQGRFGNKWTLISSHLTTERSANEIKNYWYHTLKKK